eukprot:110269-Amphidinium_carterae.1
MQTERIRENPLWPARSATSNEVPIPPRLTNVQEGRSQGKDGHGGTQHHHHCTNGGLEDKFKSLQLNTQQPLQSMLTHGLKDAMQKINTNVDKRVGAMERHFNKRIDGLAERVTALEAGGLAEQ